MRNLSPPTLCNGSLAEIQDHGIFILVSAFSTLKIIKNRLRSSLNQERLEAFMMMSAEKQVLEEVDFQDVLGIIKNSSSLLLKLLS